MFNKQPIPILDFSAARNFTTDARGYAAPSQKYLAVNLLLAGVIKDHTGIFT
jgi:hypothetical protein